MLISLRCSTYVMGSNVNLGSFEVTEATVSRSVSRSSCFFVCLLFLLPWQPCISNDMQKYIYHVKRVSISFHKMYGLLYLCQTVYLLYLIISGHLQTTENYQKKKKKPFRPQRVNPKSPEPQLCGFFWFLVTYIHMILAE